jgi:hypothetical protein
MEGDSLSLKEIPTNKSYIKSIEFLKTEIINEATTSPLERG